MAYLLIFRLFSVLFLAKTLIISSIIMTGKLKANTRIQSFLFKGAVLKYSAAKGTYKIIACNNMEEAIANIKYIFEKNPTTNKDPSSLKAFSEFNISITTNTVKDNVEAFFLPQVKYEHGSLEKS